MMLIFSLEFLFILILNKKKLQDNVQDSQWHYTQNDFLSWCMNSPFFDKWGSLNYECGVYLPLVKRSVLEHPVKHENMFIINSSQRSHSLWASTWTLRLKMYLCLSINWRLLSLGSFQSHIFTWKILPNERESSNVSNYILDFWQMDIFFKILITRC